MKLRKEDCVTLIADLWSGKYPLTREHFGPYLGQLVTALLAEQLPDDGHFVRAAFEPEALEKRLRKINDSKLIGEILDEVRGAQEPVELDRRLVDAWAEIRAISQLMRESFSNFSKVIETADLTAIRGAQKYAFQVKRINNSLDSHVQRRNTPEMRDSSPFGDLDSIHARLDEPISHFFRLAVRDKNQKFGKWADRTFKRCIVIVSSDDDLQDALVRQTACTKIRETIKGLPELNFEELVWLPDTGNGAWFIVYPATREVRCFADWSDNPDIPSEERDQIVNRKEVKLD